MRRKGQTASWLRFTKLSIPSSVLTDSPTWSPETVSETTVTATLQLWGNGVELTEALGETSFLDLPSEYKKLIGQNAGETINEKVRDIIIAGTSVNYANAKTHLGAVLSTDTADLDDFLDVVEGLEAQDANPIGDDYVGIISPYVKTRLMKDSAFREAVRYLGRDNSIFTGEIANIDGIRFVRTSTAPSRTNSGTNSSLAAVEQSLVVGDGGYGVARLLPGDFDVIVTPPGGHGDEYKVLTSIAWKAYLRAVILNQNWIRRLESAR